MSDFKFYVDIEDSQGNKLGSGPLQSVTHWRYTSRLDRAGVIEFAFAANDPQAHLVKNQRYARAFALLDGIWTEVGWGIIDEVTTRPDNRGGAQITASGLDILSEFGQRNMRGLQLRNASPLGAVSFLIASIMPDWTYVQLGTVPSTLIQARFYEETNLSVLILLTEKGFFHFVRLQGRTLGISAEFSSSGIRAIQPAGKLPRDSCAIAELSRTVTTKDFCTRLYVFGSGQGDDVMTMAATDRTAPPGFTLVPSASYIRNDEAFNIYGTIDGVLHLKDVGPLSNTNADYVASANMLFDVGLEELKRRSNPEGHKTYTLTVTGCNQLLRPLQTLRVVYRDDTRNIHIDDDLYILEATWEIDPRGARTTRLVVSTEDRWAPTGQNSDAVRAIQSRVFQSHPQLIPNSYWAYATLLVGDDRLEHIGEMYFVLGPEVVTVQRVVFRFRVLRPIFLAHTYQLADNKTAQNEAANTGATAVEIEETAVEIAVTDVEIGASTKSSTDANSKQETTGPQAIGTDTSITTTQGPIDGGGSPRTSTDQETVTIQPLSTPTLTGLNHGGFDMATQGALSTNPTEHWHDMSGHQHDYAHGHTANPHSHGMDHVHNMNHSHDVDAHQHGMEHTHTDTPHSHTSSPHTHTSPEHTHAAPQHTHPLPALTQDTQTERLWAIDTYTIDELEYAVNGGTWQSLDNAIAVGDGFWEIDITDEVTHPTIPFRPAQEDGNNVIEVRRKESAVPGKAATIYAMLGIRTTIQAVAIG